MSFQSVITQLQACLGSASAFTQGTVQVAVGDEKIYSLGKTPVAVIGISPELSHMRDSFSGGHVHEWHVGVTVGARWRDATSGPIAINAAWQSVLDQLCKYPNLGLGTGGIVREAHVESARLEPIVENYGTVKFANVELTVAIMEDVTVDEEE